MTESEPRRDWMGLLARAPGPMLDRLWPDPAPAFGLASVAPSRAA